MEGGDGSRACPSLTQIQRIKMHWELSVRRPYNQNRISNIFSEENLWQDLELQVTYLLNPRRNMANITVFVHSILQNFILANS